MQLSKKQARLLRCKFYCVKWQLVPGKFGTFFESKTILLLWSIDQFPRCPRCVYFKQSFAIQNPAKNSNFSLRTPCLSTAEKRLASAAKRAARLQPSSSSFIRIFRQRGSSWLRLILYLNRPYLQLKSGSVWELCFRTPWAALHTPMAPPSETRNLGWKSRHLNRDTTLSAFTCSSEP